MAVTRTTVEVATVDIDTEELPEEYKVPAVLTHNDVQRIAKLVHMNDIHGIPGVDVGQYTREQDFEWQPLADSGIEFSWAMLVTEDEP